jgi:membrane protease YdiL (CAAX protease family)
MFAGAVSGAACTVTGILLIFALIAWLPPEQRGASAGSFLGGLSPARMFVVAVLWIPLWETLIAQLLPLEAGRRIGLPNWACILVVAGLFGLGHYFNGGLAHGICSASAGAIFSCAYLHLRPYGRRAACLASYLAHALNNWLALYIVPTVFPQFG